MARWLTAPFAAVLALLLLVAPVSAHPFPSRIDLPDGWQPEGITAGRGNTAYVGSLADGAIAKVNLMQFADSLPHTLSGGMKQRVAIARGMAMEPDILLMDEPFAALDALTRRKMQDELLQLWDDTHFTVLFVTHSIPEAIRIGSRILLLSPHPGQVKAELNSVPRDGDRDGSASRALERKIHTLLFADEVEAGALPNA